MVFDMGGWDGGGLDLACSSHAARALWSTGHFDASAVVLELDSGGGDEDFQNHDMSECV